MVGQVQEIDLEGGRVLRLGTYELDSGDGTEPERRVFIAAGWASSPPLPVHEQTVDLPLSALPELLQALEALDE